MHYLQVLINSRFPSFMVTVTKTTKWSCPTQSKRRRHEDTFGGRRGQNPQKKTSGTCLEGNRTDIEKVGQYTGRNECPSEQEVPRHSNKGKSHTKCAHNTRRPPIRKTFTPDQRQWGADRVKERKQNNFTRWIEITSKKMMIAMKYQKNISLFNEGFCNVNFFISHL